MGETTFGIENKTWGKGSTAVGGALSAFGTLASGYSQRAASYSRAAQLRQLAPQERAAGQMAAAEEQRKGDLIRSRILAVAGASGAGVLDPNVVDLVGQNAAETSLAANTIRFNAESSARAKEAEAAAAQREGDAQARAARFGAVGSILQTGAMIAAL